MWVIVWLIFYLGTLGPFLKPRAQNTANVFMIGEYVIRMPIVGCLHICGVSRMFAPRLFDDDDSSIRCFSAISSNQKFLRKDDRTYQSCWLLGWRFNHFIV